jgi:hypothetical protein
MPSGNAAPSLFGSVGIWPVTKSQPFDVTAWLNGATGVGAPGTIRNSIIASRALEAGSRGGYRCAKKRATRVHLRPVTPQAVAPNRCPASRNHGLHWRSRIAPNTANLLQNLAYGLKYQISRELRSDDVFVTRITRQWLSPGPDNTGGIQAQTQLMVLLLSVTWSNRQGVIHRQLGAS